MSTYAERLYKAAMIAGMPQRGWQTEIAKRIGAKPQTIQYLASVANKAKGSNLTPQIAAAFFASARFLVIPC